MLTLSDDSPDRDQIHVLEIVGNAIVGGMENYVRSLVRLLSPDRFRVTCLFPFESAVTAAFRDMGCDVFTSRMDDDPPWRSIQTAVEIVRGQRIDLIHAHMPKAHVLAGLVGVIARTPVLATVHGNTITTHELGITRTTGTSLLVVCQEAYFQALAMGVPEERVTLIHNGVDLDNFRPLRSGEGFRKALNIPLDVPLIGFVGRLEWEKGPDQLLEAARYIRGQVPEVQVAVVGAGSMEQKLRAMIRELGLEGTVHMAGLWADTAQVYPAFDLVLHTSRIEGTPFAMLEAMACGRAVVTTAVGGGIEAIEVGSTGLLASPGDWQGVGERAVDLLTKPEKLKQMGRAARKRVEVHFDARESVRQTADLFERLVQARPGSRSRRQVCWPSRTVAR